MSRYQEYQRLRTDLAQYPTELEYSLTRAHSHYRQSNRIKRWLIRPIVTLACCFLLLTILVNSSTGFALAMNKVPLLKELVQLVNFSPSLELALKSDYVQLITFPLVGYNQDTVYFIQHYSYNTKLQPSLEIPIPNEQ